MWAVVDGINVIGVITPDVDFDKALEENKGMLLVEMTIDNSPAWLNGTYVDKKFYPPEGK